MDANRPNRKLILGVGVKSWRNVFVLASMAGAVRAEHGDYPGRSFIE